MVTRAPVTFGGCWGTQVYMLDKGRGPGFAFEGTFVRTGNGLPLGPLRPGYTDV